MGYALRPQKRRRKISETGHELHQKDFISRLPEDILLIILNKLPMEDAVATTLVSRTWRDLWKLASNVDFSYRWVQVTGKEIHRSVNHFVRRHHGRNIKRFSVSLRCRKRMVKDVQSWVTFAAKKHVEELYINLSDRDDDRSKNMYSHLCFPVPVLSFSSLMKLTLKSVRLDVDSFPNCKSLQELYLENLELPNDEIEGITEKSSALQVLRLVKCNMNQDLSVKISPNSDLRKLIIDDEFMVFNRENGIFIDAPKLRRIEFLPGITRRGYKIGRMGFGTEARFSLGMMFRKLGACKATSNGLLNSHCQLNFLNLLTKFRTAKVLELCSWCIQILSILKVKQQDNLLFNATTHLVLNTGLKIWELPGIALLLMACPKLENLVIVINDQAEELEFNGAFQRRYAFKPEFFWIDQEASFTDCLRQLAVVEFRISHDNFFEAADESIEEQFFYQDNIQGYSAGVELLKFLRSKSKNLAKLIFTTKKQQCQICLK